MRKQSIPQRLAAGLMSIVMLLTLLPAMSTTAEATTTTKDAKDFFTVESKVNGSTTFVTAETEDYGGKGTTAVVTIPVMYQGKGQTIQIKAAEAATWSIVLGEQPDWMTLTESTDKKTWTLTVTDTGNMPSYVNGCFLLKATPTGGGEARSIWVYYYCFNETKYRPRITTDPNSMPNGNVDSSYYKSLDFDGLYDGWAKWEFVDSKGNVTAYNADKTPLTEYGLELYATLAMCNIQGMPKKTGTISFSLRVTTVGGTSEKKDFTITIDPKKTGATFETGEKVCAEIGKAYTADTPLLGMNTLIKDDSYPKLNRESWSATGLPDGLTMEKNGTITGTVSDTTEQKVYYVKAQVSNETYTYGVGLELFVYAKPTATASETEKSVKAGEYLLWQPLADSGTEYPRWKIVSGKPEDYGLTFNPTDGGIYGTPTKDGTLTLQVQCIARDNNGEEIDGAGSDTVTLTLNIAPDRRFDLDWKSNSYSFPSVTVAEGDATSTTSTPPSRQFTVTGTGYSEVSVKVALSGTNADKFVLGADSVDTSTDGSLTLSGLKKGDQMTFTVQPDDALTAGTYTATVTVSDTDTENAAPSQSFDVSFTVSTAHVNPQITYSSASLPWTMTGANYEYQFSATGTAPITWSLQSDAPTWLSIDEATGKLTGTVPSDYTEIQPHFRVIATNKDGESERSASKEFYFYVYTPVSITMQLGSGSGAETYTGIKEGDVLILPDAYVNTNYKINDNNLIFTTEGNVTKVLSIEGMPPEGMDGWTTESGWQYFRGKPTRTGTYDFTIVAKQYTDSDMTVLVSEARQPVRLTVHEQLKAETATITDAMEVGKEVSIDLSHYVSGGRKNDSGGYTYNASRKPDWLTLDADTGMLTGAPTAPSMSGLSVSFTVTDANGKTATGKVDFKSNRIDLPALELTDASGASFINEISVGLSEDYLNMIGKTGDYKLKYRFKPNGSYGNYSEWYTATSYTGTIKLSLANILDFLKSGKDNGWEQSFDVDKSVEIAFDLIANGESGINKTATITYTRVEAPTAPTASPSAEGEEAYTFTGTTPVQLFTTTSGGGIGIAYTTDGTTPEVEMSGITATGKTGTTTQLYTGTPIEVTEDTTIKAVCFRIISKSGKFGDTSVGYGDVATFKYEKSTGVTVSGKVASYDPKKETTITLYAATDTTHASALYTGTIAAETTGSGQQTQTFTLTGVVPGTYDLVVTKAAHLTYTIKGVVVGTENLDLTAHSNDKIKLITLLCGDIDGDDSINTSDINVIYQTSNYYKSTSEAETQIADLDGDGSINTSDINIIYQAEHYYKGVAACTVEY